MDIFSIFFNMKVYCVFSLVISIGVGRFTILRGQGGPNSHFDVMCPIGF